MCHLCAVVSSLAVGKKNHPQRSSRVNQQITTHLFCLRDAPGPSSWNGQNQSPLQTPAPAQGASGSLRVSGSTLLNALPQLWGVTLAAQGLQPGGYTLLHHSHHKLGHSPHKASGLATAAVVRARQEALRLLTPCHHSPPKTKCIPQPFSLFFPLYFPPHPIKDENSP